MKIILSIIISTLVVFSCAKKDICMDDQIRYEKHICIDKITADTTFAFFIPTGFTPNSDWINDFWEPKSNYLDSSNYHITIFNKTGAIVFESDTPARFDGKGKDGHRLFNQTFVYHIEARDLAGNKYEFNGRFTLYV